MTDITSFDDSGLRPHTVWRFNDRIYKVVQFYSFVDHLGPGPREQQSHHDKKLDSSISRAKRGVLEYGLCNSWDYFCTFTLDKSRWDRFDLAKWKKAFSQWLRDQRKKGYEVQYLLVPELHDNGAWHMHGLLSGINSSDVVPFKELALQGVPLPSKLRNSSYSNWMPYAKKFGHCSLGPIRNPVAVSHYILKYLSKDLSRCVTQLGADMYYHSNGLKRPEKFVEFVDRDPEIDSLLNKKYDFCATGLVQPIDDFQFLTQCAGYDWANFCCPFEPLNLSDSQPSAPDPAELEADAWHDFIQLSVF